ncbi:MAG: hypothetical protein PHE27_02095 [Alphaproteobacteria bacterium]|nr:hypothetical protein [Alphaproteobacteria bacterium]
MENAHNSENNQGNADGDVHAAYVRYLTLQDEYISCVEAEGDLSSCINDAIQARIDVWDRGAKAIDSASRFAQRDDFDDILLLTGKDGKAKKKGTFKHHIFRTSDPAEEERYKAMLDELFELDEARDRRISGYLASLETESLDFSSPGSLAAIQEASARTAEEIAFLRSQYFLMAQIACDSLPFERRDIREALEDFMDSMQKPSKTASVQNQPGAPALG